MLPPDKEIVCVPATAVKVPVPALVVAGVVDGSVQLYEATVLLIDNPFGRDPERVLVNALAIIG